MILTIIYLLTSSWSEHYPDCISNYCVALPLVGGK